MSTTLQIRPIHPSDNPFLAKIIRTALEEFGANKLGTVYFDDSTDHLYELFQTPGSCYFVAEEDGQVLGGGGLFPTEGLPANILELVKMYLKPEARGKGIGKELMLMAEEAARAQSCQFLYLETMPELRPALGLYEHMGYTYLDNPLGNSGHSGCDKWMIKKIDL